MSPGLYADKFRIASFRLPGHDYGQAGQYFITVCTQNRHPYFGQIQPAQDALTDAHLIGTDLAVQASECWQQIPQHFSFVETDAFIIMPDHIHGILIFNRPTERADQPVPAFGPQSHNLASVVRGFKVGVKAWATKTGLYFAWQPRYFDRVVRNENELEKARKYILNNPNQWDADRCNDTGLFM